MKAVPVWCLVACLLLAGCSDAAAAVRSGRAAPTPGAAASAPPACIKPAADAKPLEIKAVGGDALVFSAEGEKAELAVPLSWPTALDATQIERTPHLVRRDKLADARLQASFAVAIQAGAARGERPSLKITVQDIGRLPPGLYQLTVDFVPRCPTPIAPLQLQLERPAAQMLAAAKMIVGLSLPIGLGWAAPEPHMSKFVLGRSDGAQPVLIRDVRITEAGWRNTAGEPVTGNLGATAASASAGAALDITIAPRHFDTGSTQGKLELRSPDWKQPLVLEVEVQTKLWKLWILLVVGAGIVLGFLLRVVLQRHVELQQARVAGGKVIQELSGRLQGARDATLQARTTPVLQALDLALRSGTAAEITARKDIAVAEVDTALADLRSRVAAAEAKLAALRRLAAGAGRLPAPMQAAVDALDAPCTAAAGALEQRNARDAQTQLDAAHAALAQALRAEWPRWRQIAPVLDADLARVPGVLDPTLAAARGLDTNASLLGAAWQQAEAELGVPDFDDLRAVNNGLDAWRALGLTRRQLLWQWSEYLRQDLVTMDADVAARLPPKKKVDAEWQSWRTASAALLQALQTGSGADDAFAAVAADAPAAVRAGAALVRAVLAVRGDVGEELHAACAKALEEERVFAALRCLPPAPPDLILDASGEAESGGKGRGAAAPLQAVDAPTASTVSARHDAPVGPDGLDTAALASLSARSARELARAQRYQTGIVAAVMLFVAYVFHEARFFGTPTELLGLFFWGFTADVSMAGLLALAGGVASKPKT